MVRRDELLRLLENGLPLLLLNWRLFQIVLLLRLVFPLLLLISWLFQTVLQLSLVFPLLFLISWLFHAVLPLSPVLDFIACRYPPVSLLVLRCEPAPQLLLYFPILLGVLLV